MMQILIRLTRRGCAASVSVLAVALFAALGAAPADAQSHRARLSSDLLDWKNRGAAGSARIIVSGSVDEIASIAARYGATIKKTLRQGAVLEVTGAQLDAMQADPAIAHLSGDVPVRPTMAVTTQAVGADQVWGGWLESVPGYTGRGVGVAVIDSGVAVHAALKGRVVASYDFTGAGVGRDQYGHGTHVAGIVAGSTAAGYSGIAPGAHIVSLRVLGADGSGETSSVIAAIDWLVEHHAELRTRIINLSLGHPVFESSADDPLCQAAQRAKDAGLFVAAAAGNSGKTADGRPMVSGMHSPGSCPAAFTVAALNTKGTPQRSDDVVASYSSRGPTLIDGLLKPDLAAPGNRIVAPLAAGSYLGRAFPERIVAGAGTEAFIEMSGTSMATPVVAGAATLLWEADPSLTPTEIGLALQLTSSRVPGAGLIEVGAGSLNVAAALALVKGQFANTVSIASESIEPVLIAFIDSSQDVSGLRWTIVWDAARTIVWDAGKTIVWDAARTIVWDAGRTIVWDAGKTIVWDAGKTIVWDAAKTIVWDAGKTIVWDAGTILGNTILGTEAVAWDATVQDTTIVWDSGEYNGD